MVTVTVCPRAATGRRRHRPIDARCCGECERAVQRDRWRTSDSRHLVMMTTVPVHEHVLMTTMLLSMRVRGIEAR